MRLFSTVAVVLLFAAPEKLTSADVPMRARAWTISTADVCGGAVVRAQDHVDVLAVVTDPETKRSAGVLLLQDVQVLANAAPVPSEGRQLSLLVTPEDAVLLATARAHGQLTVILRHPDDVSRLETKPTVSVSTVVAGGAASTPPARN